MKKAVTLADGTKVMRRADPPCAYETCKANDNGGCTALENTVFDRPCPFYKRNMKKEKNHE